MEARRGKLSEKVVVKVPAKNTSRTRLQCGFVVKTRADRVFKCTKCGFKINRQKLAPVNMYLRYTRMQGLPYTNDLDMWMKVKV